MIRANKITVVANGDNYIATFYRTHKVLASTHSEHTDWVSPDSANKTFQRESFRQWMIDHAESFDINYQPENMQAEGQVRIAQYTSTEVLEQDVIAMMLPYFREGVESAKIDGVEWVGLTIDDVKAKTHTGTGTDLTKLGIEDGKYKKSGNWAWADIHTAITMKYKEQEAYAEIVVELVSGQLRKPKITKTRWREIVGHALIDAGLATTEDLYPPKEEKSKKSNAGESGVVPEPEVVSEEQDTESASMENRLLTEDEIRKIRKKDELVEYAHSIGIAVTDIKMKDLKEKVIRHIKSMDLAKAE